MATEQRTPTTPRRAHRRASLAAATPEVFEAVIRGEVSRAHSALRWKAWATRLLALGLFLGAWWGLALSGLVNPLFISNPGAVVTSLIDLVGMSATWVDVWATFSASVLSLILGASVGISVGLLFMRSPVIRRGLDPYITIINAIPRPALAPIFILWFGLGASSKVLVGASLVFFIMLLNTMAGITGVNPDVAVLSRSLGMTNAQYFRKVQLPASLPSIIAGLRLGSVASVLGVVVSEVVASYQGLGQVLVASTNSLDISGSFAIVILMSAMAVVLDTCVALLQRRMSWDSAT